LEERAHVVSDVAIFSETYASLQLLTELTPLPYSAILIKSI
jgi:hypothetical protein